MSEQNNGHISPEQKAILDALVKRTNWLVFSSAVLVIFILFNIMAPDTASRLYSNQVAQDSTAIEMPAIDEDLVVDGIHVATGLIVDDGFIQVKASCTSCHSSDLITQNRQTREGWEKLIRWMQETQNLWDLGPNEPLILDYLAKNYAPENVGRRANLTNIEWYELSN